MDQDGTLSAPEHVAEEDESTSSTYPLDLASTPRTDWTYWVERVAAAPRYGARMWFSDCQDVGLVAWPFTKSHVAWLNYFESAVKRTEAVGSTAPAPPIPCEADAADELRAHRSARELMALRRARSVLRAANQNQTQRWIAENLGCSQTEVHRTLRSARAQHLDEGETVRELLLRLGVNEVSRGYVVGRLSGISKGVSAPRELEDGYVRGDFDDVRVAWHEGLIDDDLYEEIRAASTPGPPKHRSGATES